MEIILASSSPRRIEILKMLRLDFQVIKPEVDENVNSLKDVLDVSYLKAKSVFEKLEKKENVIVIGADTVLLFMNKTIGKPKDKKDAFNIIKSLSGRTHYVYTGLSLISKDKAINKIVKTTIRVGKIDDNSILNYIEKENIIDAAGAYKIQGLFSCLIEYIKGDYYNVMGLPVRTLYKILKRNFKIDLINK